MGTSRAQSTTTHAQHHHSISRSSTIATHTTPSEATHITTAARKKRKMPATATSAAFHDEPLKAKMGADLSSKPTFQVKKLDGEATIPKRGSDGAAGYDLYSVVDAIVPARGKAMVGTGISIAIPYGTYARIAPRSGLAWKHSIDTGAGVVDYDYRGEI